MKVGMVIEGSVNNVCAFSDLSSLCLDEEIALVVLGSDVIDKIQS